LMMSPVECSLDITRGQELRGDRADGDFRT